MQNRINTHELLNYCRTFFRAADLSASLSALRLRRSCGVAAMLTVAPESPALGVVRPAASTVTAALRTHSKGQGGTSGGGQRRLDWVETYLVVITHVPVQLVHVMRTLARSKKQRRLAFPSFFFFVCFLPGWRLRCRFLGCRSRSRCPDTPRPSARTANRQHQPSELTLGVLNTHAPRKSD